MADFPVNKKNPPKDTTASGDSFFYAIWTLSVFACRLPMLLSMPTVCAARLCHLLMACLCCPPMSPAYGLFLLPAYVTCLCCLCCMRDQVRTQALGNAFRQPLFSFSFPAPVFFLVTIVTHRAAITAAAPVTAITTDAHMGN